MSLSKPTGPRFLDPDQEAKILSSTLERNQQAVGLYIKFLSDNGFGPTCAAEHDDLMVEFKSAEKLSKAQFESLVAGVEFAQPQMKGSFPWSRAVLSGWATRVQAKHTVPLSSGPAHLISAHLAALNHARLGVGMLLQQHLGLRPSEMLGLTPEDITLPEVMRRAMNSNCAMIGLGLRTGTKAKRPQAVLLRDEVLLSLLRWV